MAESTTKVPPRPRPRPRPVVKNADAANTTATPGASSSSSIPSAASATLPVVQVRDTDEMFMRNRNRSIKTWHKLDQLDREATKHEKAASSGSDDGDSPRNKYKKKKRETSAVPAWQRNAKLTRLLSEDFSPDSDSDIEIVGTTSTPKGKRKRRQRSRSRSITPPPALPDYQIQAAKDVVRRALGRNVPRAPSPTFSDADESTDTIIFDPELKELARDIATNSHRESSQIPDGVQDHVILTVIWHPHPLDATSQKAEWEYRIDRQDDFRDLFDAVADDANILTSNLIMTYQGKRFFPSVSPAFLKIYADTAEFGAFFSASHKAYHANILLAAYEKQAYDYMQKNPLQNNNAPPSPVHAQHEDEGSIEIQMDEELDEDNSYVPQTQTQDSEAESEAEGETFKLILRSAGNKDIALTVRPTTKCGAIVKAFLKKLGVADQYPGVFEDTSGAAKATPKKGRPAKGAASAAATKDPRLCIDGDKMDNETPIGDMDLEDGDMVEVVDL